MPTRDELKQMQSLPLDVKVLKTKARIKEWVDFYGEDNVAISFSGGKDSTVLLDIVRQDYPEIKAFFVNTGLEYPEIQSFVKTFDNVGILRPTMRFDEVIKKYGYPFISKEVSSVVFYARQNSRYAINALNGKNAKGIDDYYKNQMYSRYKPLVDVDFVIGNGCCVIMKEKPIEKYTHTQLLATMASESQRREKAWFSTGCNAWKQGKSKPMSFWTEQDVLEYIKSRNLPIASVYGEIVEISNDDINQITFEGCGKLKCTGCMRTGCIFCGFGAHLDKKDGNETRFERLKRTHPKQYDYCMGGGEYNEQGIWQPNKQGLGMAHCIDELNKIYGKDFIKY